MIAAQANQLKNVRILIEKGNADVDAVNNVGHSILHKSRYLSNEMILYLITQSSSINDMVERKLDIARYSNDIYLQRMLTDRIRVLRSTQPLTTPTDVRELSSVENISQQMLSINQQKSIKALFSACEALDNDFIQFLLSERFHNIILHDLMSPFKDETLLCCAIRCNISILIDKLFSDSKVDINWKSKVRI